MKLRIGLDLDDTCNLWWDLYIARFGQPKDDYIITRHVQQVLKKDKDFWVNLPVKHHPDFDVTLYCTKRVNKKSWTKEWLAKNHFPMAPVYQVYTQSKNKADVIKGRVDVFIDDSVSNFEAMTSAGMFCLLMDAPNNRDYKTNLRVYSLKYEEIESLYNKYAK